MEVDAVRRLELRPRRRTRSAAFRYARANARENAASEPYPAATAASDGRRCAGPQLPRRALEQQPPPQRHGRLARRRRQQPVQVVAREVRPRAPARRRRRPARRATPAPGRSARAGGRPRAHLDRIRRLAGRDAPSPGTFRAMASWSEFAAAAPELAERVQERLDAHRHKTIATLRSDGSPRISGTEAGIEDGELTIGSMWQALKARDLQRDPRFALHSGSDEPDDWHGDAKVAGVAIEICENVRTNGEAASRRTRSGSTSRGLDRRPQRGAQRPRDRRLDGRAAASGPSGASERATAQDRRRARRAAGRARARDRLRPRRRRDLPARSAARE